MLGPRPFLGFSRERDDVRVTEPDRSSTGVGGGPELAAVLGLEKEPDLGRNFGSSQLLGRGEVPAPEVLLGGVSGAAGS